MGGGPRAAAGLQIAVVIRFRTEAASDVVLARDWYDAQRPGLGNDFVRALE